MADETKTDPPVDSRQRGFRPEVDAEADAEAARTAPPAPVAPAPTPAPVKPRTIGEVVNDLDAHIRSVHGSHPRYEELIAELVALL